MQLSEFRRPPTHLAAAALLAAALVGCGSIAPSGTGAPQAHRHLPQAPAYHRIELGDYQITALSDGTLALPLERMVAGIKPEEVKQLLADQFEKLPIETSINAFLVNMGHQLVLVDTGSGTLYGKDGGHLVKNLRAAGYAPEDVDAILITHLHRDHSGGLTVDGRRVFPNATVYVNKADRDFRFSDEAASAAPAHQKNMFPESRGALVPYEQAGKVVLFAAGQTLLSGVRTIAAPGHTPGHTLYVVESRGERIAFSGDLIHAAAVQLPRPEVTIAFDTNSAQAAADRRALFSRFVEERTLLAAAHISFPGVGHLRASGNGYQWVPVGYSAGPKAP